MGCDPVAATLEEHRAVEYARLDAVTELDLACLRDQRLDEAPVDALGDEDAVHGDADLVHVREGSARGSRRGLFGISIIQHDEGALAAEFERQPL
jgi:hypothetical protein